MRRQTGARTLCPLFLVLGSLRGFAIARFWPIHFTTENTEEHREKVEQDCILFVPRPPGENNHGIH
jgi:hypothetical protein